MPHGGIHEVDTARERGLSVRTPTAAPALQQKSASTTKQTIGDFLADIGAGLQGKTLPGPGRAQARQSAQLAHERIAAKRIETAAGAMSAALQLINNAPKEQQVSTATALAGSSLFRSTPGIGEALILSAQPENIENMTNAAMLLAGGDPELANIFASLKDLQEMTAFANDNAQIIKDRAIFKFQGTGLAKMGAVVTETIRAAEARGQDLKKQPLSVNDVRKHIAELRQKARSAPVQNIGGGVGRRGAINIEQQEAPDAVLPTMTEMHVMFRLAPQATQALFNQFGFTTDESFNEAAKAVAGRAPVKPTEKDTEIASLMAQGFSRPEAEDIAFKRILLRQSDTGDITQFNIRTQRGQAVDVEGRASPTQVSAKPKETLFQLLARLPITGAGPAALELLERTVGQIPGVDIGEEVIQARQTFKTSQLRFVGAVRESDRFSPTEMAVLIEETDISPEVFDSKEAMHARMVSIRDSLVVREINERRIANDKTLDKKERNSSRATASSIRDFLSLLGEPGDAAGGATLTFTSPAAVGEASLEDIQTFVDGASNADLDLLSPATRAALARKLRGE